jgi:hypothetical protein
MKLLLLFVMLRVNLKRERIFDPVSIQSVDGWNGSLREGTGIWKREH